MGAFQFLFEEFTDALPDILPIDKPPNSATCSKVNVQNNRKNGTSANNEEVKVGVSHNSLLLLIVIFFVMEEDLFGTNPLESLCPIKGVI